MSKWLDIEACDQGAEFGSEPTDHERMLCYYGLEECWMDLSGNEQARYRYQWRTFGRKEAEGK